MMDVTKGDKVKATRRITFKTGMKRGKTETETFEGTVLRGPHEVSRDGGAFSKRVVQVRRDSDGHELQIPPSQLEKL